MGLEGIVSKHAMAPYRSGRSKTLVEDEMLYRAAKELECSGKQCRLLGTENTALVSGPVIVVLS